MLFGRKCLSDKIQIAFKLRVVSCTLAAQKMMNNVNTQPRAVSRHCVPLRRQKNRPCDGCAATVASAVRSLA